MLMNDVKMLQRHIISSMLLLVLAAQCTCQFQDFFQSLNDYLKPYQTGGTYSSTNPFSFDITTSKPKKKNQSSNRSNNKNNRQEIITKKQDNIRNVAQTFHNIDAVNKIPTSFNNNVYVVSDPTTNNKRNGNKVTSNNSGTSNYETTKILNNKRITSNSQSAALTDNRAISNNRAVTQNNRPNQNVFATGNPLLNRPGVRPANVDENRPPITNRPVTKRPSHIVFPVPTDPGAITFPEEPNLEPQKETGPNEDDMTEVQKRRYIEIAEEMCDSYKELNVKKVVALPLGPNNGYVEFNVTDCARDNVPLIIGGKVVTIKEFPHMALIGWLKLRNGGYSWKCGGSLVSDRYVLTAGHCTYLDKDANLISGPPRAVQLGSSYLDDPGALVVQISSIIQHPKYRLSRSYHDIALVKLAQKITFSDVVSPACLGVPPAVDDSVITTGWGRTEFGGDNSLQLRSVSLNVWDMQECKEIWGTSRKLPDGPSPDNQICAGVKKGGQDTCQGDSGGPAQIQDKCVWRVVAVTSIGRSCGAPDTPAVYATIPRAFVAAQVFGNIKPKPRNQAANNQASNQPRNTNNPSRNRNEDSVYNQGINNQDRNFDNQDRIVNNQGRGNDYQGVNSNNWDRNFDNQGRNVNNQNRNIDYQGANSNNQDRNDYNQARNVNNQGRNNFNQDTDNFNRRTNIDIESRNTNNPSVSFSGNNQLRNVNQPSGNRNINNQYTTDYNQQVQYSSDNDNRNINQQFNTRQQNHDSVNRNNPSSDLYSYSDTAFDDRRSWWYS